MPKPSHDVQNGDKANRDGFGALDRLLTQGSGMLSKAVKALKKSSEASKKSIPKKRK